MTTGTRRWLWPVGVILAWGVVGTLRAWPAASVVPGGVPDAAYPLWSFWHFAYSDIVALYSTRGIYRHLWPYIQVPLEYPPVIGLFLWLASWAPKVQGYLLVNAAALVAAAIGAYWAAAVVQGERAARLWAFSPLLAVYLVYNWDVLGIIAYGLAAVAYHRRRYAWAGVFVGLGIATKLFPIVLLPYLFLDRWREGDRRAAWSLAGAAVGSFVVVNAPFAAVNWNGWSTFWFFNTTRNASPGFWQWLLTHQILSIAAIDGLSFVLVAAMAVALAALVLRGRASPWVAGAILLTWWLWMNKVYSPQYMVWVLYAWVIAGGASRTAWLFAVAGLLDFALAMLWLATGYSHVPQVALVGTYLAPVVIGVRYIAFGTVLWRARAIWSRAGPPETAAVGQ
jgi:hypothetical protein